LYSNVIIVRSTNMQKLIVGSTKVTLSQRQKVKIIVLYLWRD